METKNNQSDESAKKGDGQTGFRLNKFLSHAGVASRRKSAEIVKAGKVKVNGRVEDNPAVLVDASDTVEYKGKVLSVKKDLHYLLLNKPKNVISTTSDDRGRKTVLDLVDKGGDLGVFPVGRLDRNTTGLILLTNDGDLSQKLTHPSFEVSKVYQLLLDREVAEEDLEKIRRGISLEEGIAKVDAVNYVQDQSRDQVAIELHIGWNRVIRRIFEKLEYRVVKLDRVYFAGLTKKNLSRGRFRPLTKVEVIRLKHFNDL